jgi:hypothetical protein|tara:strand:- start:1116 stop:1292 length:177 start_codon:yes stop_codon:yes gene_type:complete
LNWRSYLDFIIRGETVQLTQELKHGALDFTIAGLFTSKTLCANRIKFINEDNSSAFIT